jgi:uncharacterized protein (DUF302 family)
LSFADLGGRFPALCRKRSVRETAVTTWTSQCQNVRLLAPGIRETQDIAGRLDTQDVWQRLGAAFANDPATVDRFMTRLVSIGIGSGPRIGMEKAYSMPINIYSAKETMDRLESEAKTKGMKIFARIDQAAGAEQAGLMLRPTELLMFGAAKAGTPLMQPNQTIGIDLPLKALTWEDASGQVWLSYNDPAWLAIRHGLGDAARSTVEAMSAMLKVVSRAAVGAGSGAGSSTAT